jgi:WD40 repeat protein
VADARRLCSVSSPDDEESWVNHCPVAVSPNNHYLAFSDKDHSVVIWEIASRQEVHRLRGPQRELAALAFSPCGKKLISAGVDMRPIVWDLAPRRKASSPPRTN